MQQPESEYRRLMTQLALLGDGATMKFDKDSVKGGEKSSTPSGVWAKFDDLPLCSQLALEWTKATTPDAQWDLIRRYEHLREEFRKAKDAPAPKEETWDQLRQRIIREGKDWDDYSVANALKLTRTQVRKARRETVRILATEKHYGKAKYTVREIATITSLPKSTVQDEMKRAA